jgi:trehalose 6-phosphate phosphatase
VRRRRARPKARTRPLLSGAAWAEAAQALRRASRRGRPALIAFDFDGTLAPIASRPERARVPPDGRRWLSRAARTPGLRVAVLSARPMADLARYLQGAALLRVAQYGLEGGEPVGERQIERFRRGVRRLHRVLEPVATRYRGAWIEDKGLTIALHYRAVAAARRGSLLRTLRAIEASARRLGFHTEPGRRVTDFVPARYDKGRALRALRRRVRPAVTFYFGDTAGDEPAFAALGRSDFAVRVGAGPTAAPYRVRGPGDVARFLRALVALRMDSMEEEVPR